MVDYPQAWIGKQGALRGVEFEWLGVDGEGGRRVPVVPMVGRDTPGTQDQGADTVVDNVDGFVFGLDWLEKRDALEKELNVPGLKTLSHPVVGLITVRVISWRWSQRSNVTERADFSMRFVRLEVESEAIFEVPEFSPRQITEARQAIEADAESRWGLLNRFNEFTQKAVNKLRAANDALLAAKGRINARFAVADTLAFAIQDLDDSLESLLSAPNEIAGKFSNLVLQVFDLIRTGTTLKNQRAPLIIIDVVRDLAQFGSDDADRSRTTPQREQLDDTLIAINEDVRAFALIGASKALTDPAIEYDSANTASQVRSDMASFFDGVLESEKMTPDAFHSLSEILSSLSDFLTHRVQQLPSVTTYTPPATVPAILIAHELYGDATRAEEIVFRNGIKNPNMVPGGVPLEVLVE